METVSKKMNPKKPTPRHIIIKMLDIENLKICRSKTSTYIQENPHKVISRFLSRNLTGQKELV